MHSYALKCLTKFATKTIFLIQASFRHNTISQLLKYTSIVARVDMETETDHQTPMHYAAKYNSLTTMKVLIKFDGSIIQRDGLNRTVLFLAAEQGILRFNLFLERFKDSICLTCLADFCQVNLLFQIGEYVNITPPPIISNTFWCLKSNIMMKSEYDWL